MLCRPRLAIATALTMVLLAGACGGGGDDEGSSGPLPTAPDSARVDLAVPAFPNPTEITNPLFPISGLTQVIQLGTEADKTARVEFTVLRETRAIDWNGSQVETRIGQFLGFSGGELVESARDFLAQGADGSVWYFGEEVDNYRNGRIVEHEGNWLAGRDGPPGMIMPANPAVGMVYRPENIPGVVFEEDTVKAVDQSVNGPRGPVKGAILVRELLMEGTTEDKSYAPGYGEFNAGSADEQVTVAVASPTDVLGTPMPAELATLYTGSVAIFDAVPSQDWARVSTELNGMTSAWAALVAAGPPPQLLVSQMNTALAALVAAEPSRKAQAVRDASLDVGEAALDMQLQYRPVPEVDAERLLLWARRALVDVGDEDVGTVAGDVATMGWIWDRLRSNLDPAKVAQVDALVARLREEAANKDLDAVLGTAQELVGVLRA